MLATNTNLDSMGTKASLLAGPRLRRAERPILENTEPSLRRATPVPGKSAGGKPAMTRCGHACTRGRVSAGTARSPCSFSNPFGKTARNTCQRIDHEPSRSVRARRIIASALSKNGKCSPAVWTWPGMLLAARGDAEQRGVRAPARHGGRRQQIPQGRHGASFLRAGAGRRGKRALPASCHAAAVASHSRPSACGRFHSPPTSPPATRGKPCRARCTKFDMPGSGRKERSRF
jgi:hypothetical protein